MSKTKYYKVLFRQLDEDGDLIVESLWATKFNNHYRIENIPFYIKEVSYKDIVEAKLVDGENLAIQIVKESGHTTVRIYFNKFFSEIDKIREELKKMGCSSEISNNPRLIALDIPVNVDYQKVQEYLISGEREKYWEYEESCLAHDLS